LILALRYKELSGGSGKGGGEVPFEITGHLTEIDTGKIDADYMNSRFDKYLKTVQQGDNSTVDHDAIQKTLDELHKSFATLTQEEQKIANQFLNDVQRGEVMLEEGKTFRQYISEYQSEVKQAQMIKLVDILLDKDNEVGKAAFYEKLNKLMNTKVTECNINEFGRFDDLKNDVDKTKAKAYFEALEGKSVSSFKVNMKVDKLLKQFILSAGIDV